MIVSHRHRYIFLHCRKAAGSAVKVSLYRDLGPWDLAVTAWGDAAQYGIRPNPRTLWLSIRPPGGLTLAAGMVRTRLSQQLVNTAAKRSADYLYRFNHGHATAANVRDAFPRDWVDYFKFCVVRNPYDRVLSDYRWRTRNISAPPSFRTYLEAIAGGRDLDGVVSPFFDTWPFYTIDDEVVVDRACRFENLQADLASALDAAGVDWDGWLPHVKVASGRRDYREYYTQHERRIVARLFGREIDEFSYTF